MMSKKVFAFDMDGTLLNSQGVISSESLVMLKKAKEKGHILVLCSGRSIPNMINIAKEAGCFDYLVCNNGTYFMDMKTKKIHANKFVPTQTALELLEIGRANDCLILIHTPEKTTCERLWTEEPEWVAKNVDFQKYEEVSDGKIESVIQNSKITQATLRSSKQIVEKIVKKEMEHFTNCEFHIAGEVYIDVNPPSTSKLTGLEDLAKYVNVQIENFIAFGDSGNDIQMLSGVGLGIAMENATRDAKDAASIVIGDNDSNAIAEILETLI